MDECCNNKASYIEQNVQFNGIVTQMGLNEFLNSSQDAHCSKQSNDNILTEMANLSPRLQNVNENTFQDLENNAHSLLSDGTVLENSTSLDVPEYSNGDDNLQSSKGENLGETTMLLDSHYYNVLGYDYAQSCEGGFETLIVGSTIKASYKEDHKTAEIQTEQSQYMQNNVLIADSSYCEVPVEQFRNHDNGLCTKNMVADICSQNANQIILENQRYDKDAKFIELSQQISEEFQFDIANSLNESPQMTSENQVHINEDFSNTSDAASEVALTLANLGNMESHQDLSQADENLLMDRSKIVIANRKENPKCNVTLKSQKQQTINESSGEISILKENTNSVCLNNESRKRPHIHSMESVKREKSSISAQFSDCNRDGNNLLGKFIQTSQLCEPESLISECVGDAILSESVVDDVIPAVGYRIMDMYNLSEMVGMMHNCTAEQKGPVVIQEQVSQREGAVSHISLICTGCQEGTVCPTSNRNRDILGWDINSRVEKLRKEFNIEEVELQKMLEILGIFYRPSLTPPSLIQSVPSEKVKPTIVGKHVPAKILKTNKKTKKKVQRNTNSDKDKKYECETCKQKFLHAHHLKTHMLIHNTESRTCPYCHAYFKKRYNLLEHIKKHENVKYECNLCSREYTDRSTLMKHMSSFHEEKSIVDCEFCGKKFYHRAHYNEHKRTHTKEMPFFCKLCGKRFRFQEGCKKHMACHSQPKFMCIICERKYRRLVSVRRHVMSIHKISKEDAYSNISEDTNKAEPFQDNLQSKTADMDDTLSDINLLHEIDIETQNKTCRNEVDIDFNSKQDFLCDVPINQSNEVFIF